MLRLASDHNVHDGVIQGLQQREPALDVVRVRDVKLARAPDEVLLEWAAQEDRVIITGDVQTLVGVALSRVRTGHPMPGVLVLGRKMSIGQAIDEILLVASAQTKEEIKDQVVYLPM
jgi:hypothetical protein